MKARLSSVVLMIFGLTACGGGGGSTVSVDITKPVVSKVTVGAVQAGRIALTAEATDAVGVTAYCFKASASNPLASDSCFQPLPSATVSIVKPQSAPLKVWAKDAAGNVSDGVLVGCSEAGLSAAVASALPAAVCVSTSLGEMVIGLETVKAPVTTANFLAYVNDGFYGQTVFHRVISSFMIQGGGYTGVPIGSSNVKSGLKQAIVLESTQLTGLSNTAGTIAMARTNVPNSATSQFFINVVNNTGLNYASDTAPGYAVFGRVISGDATVQAIRNVAVVSNGSEVSQPTTPPVISWAYQVK